MHPISRRNFLKTTSAGIGVLAGSQFLPTGWARAQPAEALVKAAPYDKAQLRALAQKVLEAARAAGARFADVRILTGNALSTEVSSMLGMSAPGLQTVARIGVRAVVDNTMGFAGGILELDADKAASLARVAVARSKGGQSRKARAFEFAPAPVVPNGSWQTPIEIDPFTVPLGEQEALLLEALEAAKKAVPAQGYHCLMNWVRRDEIFASTEGSNIEQRTYTVSPMVTAFIRSPQDEQFWISRDVATVRAGGFGYEAILKSNLKAEWPRAADEVARLSKLPIRSVEVGRYDLVFSAAAAATLVADTIGHPLELDRALLLTANTKGTTYAMPPADVLGKYQLGSALVNITADRSRPGSNATVGWDAEGVKPEEFALVKNGVLVDYLTDRQTAPSLRAWYEGRDQSVRSHGCASGSGGVQPSLNLPNLTLHPGSAQVSEEDLIKGIKRGFYIDSNYASVDQTGLNTQAGATFAQEIVNGRRTGMVKDMAVQFTTPQFWKGVDAIGGPASAATKHVIISSLSPERLGTVGVSTVPVRVRKVNVVNTGKQS